MTNKRYRIIEKTTGDILLDMPFEKREDAVSAVRELFAKGIKPDEMECSIIEGDSKVADYEVVDKALMETMTIEQMPTGQGAPPPASTTRRTRRDKGGTHAKDTLVKRIRRGQSLFAVPLATLVRCGDSRASLTEALSKLEHLKDYAVIQGRLSLPERVVNYKLRGSGEEK